MSISLYADKDSQITHEGGRLQSRGFVWDTDWNTDKEKTFDLERVLDDIQYPNAFKWAMCALYVCSLKVNFWVSWAKTCTE